jgi:hypothetical protein
MKITSQCSRMTATGLLAVSFLLTLRVTPAQEMTVRGRVLYNPKMSDCRLETPCTDQISLTRPEDWRPPPAAVNVIVQGTDRVTRTNKEGYYEISVPSQDASLMFLYIGHDRLKVPVQGRAVVNVKLTPTPLPVIERLLGLIMPRIYAMEYPDIDQLATDARVNRETARDILWLVLGNRRMAQYYRGEFIPDYRFSDGSPRSDSAGGQR